MSTKRYKDVKTVAIASGDAISAAIDLHAAAFGMVQWPAAMTQATCTFTGCDTEGGTYIPVHDENNTVISRAVTASKAIALPNELLAFKFGKIVMAGNEAAARTLKIHLGG